MLALLVGGVLSVVAGSGSSAAPARAATPRATPRADLSTTVVPSADCTIFSGTPDSASQCDRGSDNVVGSDGNGALYRTMVSFDGGLGIPAGSKVLSSTLTIHVLGAFGSTTTWVFAMTRPFTPGAATWNTYDGAHPWGVAGGDYNNSLQASTTVSAAGTVSFSITPLTQAWADGTNTLRELTILGFSPKGNVYSFGNKASGDPPVLTIAYQPPSSPGTTTTPTVPTGPVVSTPVSTPLPISHAPRALRIKVVMSWTWSGSLIRLRRVKVGRMPGDTHLTLRCQGGGCPRRSNTAAAGARPVRRLLERLAGRRYRAGDILMVKLTAKGYRQERARIFFRDGKTPLILK
jgi:hypothetical protein